ncbi:MAG: NAD(P)/FAD-dependent oxidoreductase [Bdellovibrionales bacterium]|nr:NAD(P)/FAD-dependent oxidoreductase [Bdellovibrionales bacterium]
MKKNFLIIGSGISSLTLAVLLLQAGHQVKILEQHYLPGGYLHCFKRFGFRFDTGAHYVGALGDGLPFQKILKYLGVYHADDYVALNDENVDSYFFDDWKYSYSIGYEENIRKLSDDFPSEKEAIAQYFQLVKTSAHSFPTYYFKEDYDQSVMLKFLEMTLDDVLKNLNISGKLAEILRAPCVLHGVSPQDVSFGVHSILIDSIMVSSHGFKNGGEKLADRFVKKIKELGGELLLSHKVNKIDVENGIVTRVHCENGSSFAADEYIAGIHPKLVFDFIGQDKLKPAFRSRLNSINESAPFVGAYVIMKNNLNINPRSNYYFMPNDIRHSFKDDQLGLDNQFGFCASPLRTYQAEGLFPLSIHASCPRDFFDHWKGSSKKITDPDYLAAKEKVFEPLFQRLNQRFEGFSEAIIEKNYSSNLTNSRFNPSPNGSAYGFYHDQSLTGVRALGPRTHFNNLYLTGQNSLFPGLLGATISGLRTSGFFTGIKDILRQLQNEL